MLWTEINKGADKVKYRRLPVPGFPKPPADGRPSLPVPASAIAALTVEAFKTVSHFMPAAHLEAIASICRDPGASREERCVAAALIGNAVIAAEGVLPICQDTGTATVVAWKGEGIITGADDQEVISAAIRKVWREQNFRFSQVAPLSMFEERNTGDNLPAQVDIYAVPGREYRFLFIAKGGGSSNKTVLIQGSKAILDESAMEKLMVDQIRSIGPAACPPYHLAVVVGGTSPEENLKTLKLATAGWLDGLPAAGSASAMAFRDRAWEKRVMEMARGTGVGAQFGGKHLAISARVIRLPRHAASCPVSIGVSCCAHRNLRGKITAAGVFLEEMETTPARFLDDCRATGATEVFARVDLDRPMDEILAALSRRRAGEMALLDGTIIVARDMAHARFIRNLRSGKGVPDYLKKHPVFYAGPSETPPGRVIGSLGPTTGQRMDPYAPELMAKGASLVMIAKGPRSPAVAEACRKYGGCCLAAIGGASALIAQEHVLESEVIDFADLGMEAVRRIRVKNLPVFVVIDRKGRSAYAIA